MSRRRVKPGSTMADRAYEYYFLGRWRRIDCNVRIFEALVVLSLALVIVVLGLRFDQLNDRAQLCAAEQRVYDRSVDSCIDATQPWNNQ